MIGSILRATIGPLAYVVTVVELVVASSNLLDAYMKDEEEEP